MEMVLCAFPVSLVSRSGLMALLLGASLISLFIPFLSTFLRPSRYTVDTSLSSNCFINMVTLPAKGQEAITLREEFLVEHSTRGKCRYSYRQK